MTSKILRAVALVVLLVTALPSIGAAAPARVSPPDDASLARQSALGATSFSVLPNGSGDFFGETDQATQYYLPIVRTDGPSGNNPGGPLRDTVIHVTNASNNPNTVTLTFYDDAGAVVLLGTPPALASRASLDYDVAANVPGTFNGAATVVGSQPIAVSATLQDPGANENLDSYSGLATGTSATYLTLAPNGAIGYDANIYVQNTSATSVANVTVTFYKQGQVHSTISTILQRNGHWDLDVNKAIPVGFPPTPFSGQAEIQSDVPIAVAGDLNGAPVYGAAALATTPPANKLYIPRYNYCLNNCNSATYNTGLVLMNTDAGAAHSYTLTIYNADGTVAATADSGSITALKSWNYNLSFVVSSIGSLNLPDPFTGWATITSDDNSSSATALIANLIGSGTSFTTLSSYAAPSILPSGTTTVVPGLKNNDAWGLSTGFAALNADSTTQNYLVSFYAANGSLASSTSLTLTSGQYTYIPQPGTQPTGFSGSATIQSVSCGNPPFVVGDVDAGTNAPAAPQLVRAALASSQPNPSLSVKVYLPIVDDDYTACR